MRRLRTWLILGSVLLACGAAALAWRLWPETRRYYTDALTIRQPLETTRPRDVLWTPPIQLSELINTSHQDYEPRLSWDGLTLFFVRGKAGGGADIYLAQRTPSGWSDPRALDAINSNYDDLGPEPSSDGQSLYFYSDRPGGRGGYDLWVSHAGPSGWQTPINLGPKVNSEFNDYGPALSPDGGTLYYASNRPVPDDARDPPNPEAWAATVREDLFYRTYDLYRARLSDAGAAEAERLAELCTPFNEGAPCVSPAGDFLYLASDRPGGAGGFDIYRSRVRDGTPQAATNLGEGVNTPANELDPGLAQLGFALYFSSDRAPLARSAGEAQSAPNPPAAAASQPTLAQRASAARDAAEPDYNVYYTASREVFADAETIQRARIDWAALLTNLLWLLLLLLLLLLFLVARDLKDRRIGLLARCLLASLMLHMLLLLLLGFWQVGASIAETLRGRGRTQITLDSPTRSDSLAMQLRGDLTRIDAPAPQAVSVERLSEPIEPTPPAARETLTSVKRLEVEPALAEPRFELAREAPTRRAEAPTPAPTDAARESPRELALALPQAAERDAATEVTPTVDAALARAPDAERAEAFRDDPLARSRPIDVAAARLDPNDLPRVSDAAPSPAVADARSAPAGAPPAQITGAAQLAAYELPPTALPPVAAQVRDASEQSRDGDAAARPAFPDIVAREIEPTRAATPAMSSRASAPTFASAPPAPRRAAPPDALLAADVQIVDASAPAPVAAPRRTDFPPPAMPEVALRLTLPSLESGATPPEAEGEIGTPQTSVELVRAPAMARESASPPRLVDAAPVLESAPAPPFASSAEQDAARTADGTEPAGAPRTAVVPAHVPSALGLPAALSAPGASIQPLDLRLETPIDAAPPARGFAQRDEQRRQELLRRLGGDDRTERAVALALRWLAKHQAADGHWDSTDFDAGCGGCDGATEYEVDRALTGLSLLAFLGAGHTHAAPGPYQDVVRRGLNWLTERQRRDGDLRGDETMYTQGIVAIALAEAEAMSGDVSLTPHVEAAARFIADAANEEHGGWRYEPGQVGDTSVLGWQVMALHGAQRAGVDVPRRGFEAARQWLAQVESPQRSGLYSYRPGQRPTPSMTAEAMFSQQLLGGGRDLARMNAGVELLARYLPDWESALNTYYWYYGTLALFHHGGPAWERWNGALRGELLDHQERRGPAAGSWPPGGEWAPIGGRVYQTAICALMLEVYYRYLPMYATEPQLAQADGPVTDSTDLVGVIRGGVRDADSGEPLPGARVRLELPNGPPIIATTDEAGRYTLPVPSAPDFFALSASLEGYTPDSVNVPSSRLRGGALDVDFALRPERENVVAMEIEPQVHHLGNDTFEGRINSQFQKSSEGRNWRVQFELADTQLPPHYTRARVRLLARGVQCPHRIVINGAELPDRLDSSPRDGSFGEFEADVDIDSLLPGENTLTVRGVACQGDIDDFEFVNVQIRLSR